MRTARAACLPGPCAQDLAAAAQPGTQPPSGRTSSRSQADAGPATDPRPRHVAGAPSAASPDLLAYLKHELGFPARTTRRAVSSSALVRHSENPAGRRVEAVWPGGERLRPGGRAASLPARFATAPRPGPSGGR
ncbi:hypothetical protein [Nonomuraea sp. NPDC049695]|uniref:hypothetical protein n=1 Tax=Nonomuraea sp. NPDC049695 TaxID=3154734 RepID=UPI00344A96F7